MDLDEAYERADTVIAVVDGKIRVMKSRWQKFDRSVELDEAEIIVAGPREEPLKLVAAIRTTAEPRPRG